MARTQKITKYQVDQWKTTLEQMLEEGNFRQDGRPLSPAGIAERKREIAMLRGLNTPFEWARSSIWTLFSRLRNTPRRVDRNPGSR